LLGSSEPGPLGVVIVAQVPFGTYFQALLWKSAFAVPAQVVPGPAAQSLLPFKAMPKHLSMVGCGGFGPANAGGAIIARAAAKELAMAAASALFEFMGDPFRNFGVAVEDTPIS
jgi:hypothetical protein